MTGKVLMLLNAPYPSDIRVKKESDALIKAGYEVYLLCLRKKNEPYEEEIQKLKVTRIDAGKNNYVLAYWDVVMSINFVHPRFKSEAQKLLSQEEIVLIHIHDLPLAGTALSLRKNNPNLKVIVDLHENYPEALKTWFKWKRNPIVRLKNRLFLNPTRWTRHEKKACHEADEIIAVVDEMKQRLVERYQITGEKITVVTNTEDKSFINQELDETVYQELEGKFILTYSGGIGPHRGVDIAIRGMSFLTHLPIHLVVVGFGSPSVMDSLKALVKHLRINNVHFLGFQPFSKFYSYMHLADANVIPHQSNGHTDNTVPHKLFQGMMAEKPLVVSTCAPLKRYVRSYDCGVVFKAGDEKDFADKVEMLYRNKPYQIQLAKNGYDATIRGDLNWECTQLALIELYNRLSS